MAIRAVTFDFWNTLVGEHDGARGHRIAAIRGALLGHGIERSVDEIDVAADALRVWFDEEWVGNRVVHPESGAAQLVAALAIEPEQGVLDDVAAVFHEGSEPQLLTIAPGIEAALTDLGEAGIRVGIICDTGFAPGATLRRYLDHHGLLRHFDHWSFSNEVGAFKPSRLIFDHAATGLGIHDPAATAHVGDLRRTDVGGARAMGWTAVRYRGLNDDTDAASPDAPIVIAHHDDLLTVLGIR